MSSKKSVLIVGPGFIGWNVVDLLVAEGYQVTGFVRRKEHGEQIIASGASAVYGDLDDKSAITQHTLKHDIIFHTATADHLPSVLAILDGIRLRAAQDLQTIFIHTSGTSVLDDSATNGNITKSPTIYPDSHPAAIDALPDHAPHRQIDLAIVRARPALAPSAHLAIMIPPLIYGFNPAHQRLSIQIPTLTRFALKHGYAPYIGAGAGVESNIHVRDLARAYVVLLHHLETSPPAAAAADGNLPNPYWFCEATGDAEPSWREVAGVIGEALVRAGRIAGAAPREVKGEEARADLFGEFTGAVVGLNSRSRAVRLRELGWAPREKGWKESFAEDELPRILEEDVGGFAGYMGTAAS